MHRLRPRSLARQINCKRTLPQRLWREARWAWRDLKDLHAEITRWTDKHVAGPPERGYQSELTEKDIARDGF